MRALNSLRLRYAADFGSCPSSITHFDQCPAHVFPVGLPFTDQCLFSRFRTILDIQFSDSLSKNANPLRWRTDDEKAVSFVAESFANARRFRSFIADGSLRRVTGNHIVLDFSDAVRIVQRFFFLVRRCMVHGL